MDEPTASPRCIRKDLLHALLESRRVPPTVATCFLKTIRLHLIQVILMGTLAGIFWYAGSDEAAVGFAGIWLGTFLRDFGWFRASVKLWPTWEAVVDWERVERLIAKSESDRPNS